MLQEESGDKYTFYNYDNKGNLYSKRTDERSTAGNLTRVDTFGALKDNVNSTVELYSYDGLNRLNEVRKGGITAQYTYNAEGIRTSKTVNGVTTEFLLDGANVVAETKNGSTTNYIRGLTGIISSSIQGTNNTTKYYTSDGHGNITKLTDSTGTIVKTYVYDAFGVEQNIDSNDTNPFRYCGEYYDSEIGQIYLRARYYSPRLGRFTQQDIHWTPDNMIYGDRPNEENPIPSINSIMQSNNLYVYVTNNPLLFKDLSGFSNSEYTVFERSEEPDVWIVHVTVTDDNGNTYKVGAKITSVGIIKFEFDKNSDYLGIVVSGNGSLLASSLYKAAKGINKDFLKGRTISGIETELVAHYAVYKTPIFENFHENARQADMGGLLGKGYDSNAIVFEVSNIAIKAFLYDHMYDPWVAVDILKSVLLYL